MTRLATVALLSTVLGVACGGGEEDPSLPPFNNTPTGGGTAGAGTTGGAGGFTAGTNTSPVITQPVGTTGGLGGTAAGTTGGTTAGTSMPGATGGGGADSQWCQVKKALGVRCTSCHGAVPTSGAPFPLVTYADFTAAHPTKAGKKVYERVGVRVHADKSQLENLGSMPPGTELPKADLALVDAWVAAKAPGGADPTCAGSEPVAVQPSVEWPPKECDAVYKIVAHGAGGVDTPLMATPGGETHPQVKWDAPWGSEQVQAIGYKTITDNSKVLHHWILSASGAFITGWAPGEDGIKMSRPDVGALLPGGKGVLNLDMHYFNTTGTKAEPDNSGVEICIVKKEHFRKNTSAVTMGLSSFFINIPAHSTNYDVKASCTVGGSSPITIMTASPHAHKNARHMKFDIKKKNGTAIIMHDAPFMFGEQKTYPLDPPIIVEAGDVINTTCTYTNDGNTAVTFGENTGNEMCFNFASYYPAGALTCGAGGLDIGSIFGGN